MSKAVIQDWVESEVMLSGDDIRQVRYRVFRDGERHYQEVRGPDESPIHVLELPDGMRLDRSSYEVLLRYVLSDAAA